MPNDPPRGGDTSGAQANPVAPEPRPPEALPPAAMLADVLDGVADRVVALDRAWTITYVNANAAQLLGRPRVDLVGASLWDIAPGLSETPFAATYRRAMDERTTLTIEEYYAPYDATYEVRCFPMDTGLVLISRDVSEAVRMRDAAAREVHALTEARRRAEDLAMALRASEAWYRRIVSTAHEGVWVIDAHGRSTYANARMAEMLGCTVDDVLGGTMLDFMDPVGRAEAEKNIERRRGGAQERHDFRFVRRDGGELWATLSTNPIYDDAGAYLGALAMVSDVTARRRAERHAQVLADAGRTLGGTLDAGTLAADLAQFLVANVADAAHVAIADESTAVVHDAVAHRDHTDAMRTALDALLAGPRDEVTSVFVDDLDGTHEALAPFDAAFASLVDARSILVVPLGARGRRLGALRLARRRGSPAFGTHDRDLVVDLAVRAATAFDNATLFASATRATQALGESFAVLDTLLGGAPVGFGFLDRDLHFARANARLAGILGVDDLHGRALAEVIPDLAPAMVSLATGVLANGNPVLNRDMARAAADAPAGRRHYIASYYPVRDPEGGVFGVGCIVVEITDRVWSARERERLLGESERAGERTMRLQRVTSALSRARALSEVADVVVSEAREAVGAHAALLGLVDPARTVIELVKSVGYAPESLDPWRSVPLDSPLAMPTCAREGTVQTAGGVVSFSDAPGDPSTQTLLAVPLVTDGPALGSIGFRYADARTLDEDELQFATTLGQQCAQAVERAQLYESEARARREAEGANKMKDEWLATVSHELRTPLGPVLGYPKLLRAKLDDPAAIERGLAIIERNGRALQRIVEDLLDVSRIIGGKLVLAPRPMELAGVVTAAVEAVRANADAKKITIETTVDPDAVLVADPDRVQQVTWNLVHNAIKFSPVGGTITVRGTIRGDRVRLAVRDSGQGIPRDFLPHLWDRFRQADSSITRAHGGLGIGLSIVKQLVELHGGTVKAESDGPGRGATFTVDLPVEAGGAMRLASPIARRASRTDVAVVTSAQLAGVRVLVVDDEDDSRLLLAAVLQTQGATTYLASNALDGWRLLGEKLPDVIVSDLGMPQTDGFAFIRTVRALDDAKLARTPAIAVTAYARDEDRRKAIEHGFDAHVAKPVEPAELIAVVSRFALRK